MNTSSNWSWRWMRGCIAASAIVTLLGGCASTKKDGSPLAGKFEEISPVRTASYQDVTIDDGPPKKIDDPVGLKLRYAKWMEEIENYAEAKDHYSVVLQERPEHLEAVLGIARIDYLSGRNEDAEAGFKKALSLQPQSSVAKNALGQFYASNQRWAEGLPLLTDATMGDPGNKTYRYHLAVALAKSGDIEAALPHFVNSVGEVPAHFNIGMVLKQKGEYRQAEMQFLQALAKDPNFEQAKQAVTEVRQLAQAADTYAGQGHSTPQIQPTGHQSIQSLTPAQQEQLRNQRQLPHGR